MLQVYILMVIGEALKKKDFILLEIFFFFLKLLEINFEAVIYTFLIRHQSWEVKY